jgi:hypothetical protein
MDHCLQLSVTPEKKKHKHCLLCIALHFQYFGAEIQGTQTWLGTNLGSCQMHVGHMMGNSYEFVDIGQEWLSGDRPTAPFPADYTRSRIGGRNC